MLKSSPDAAAIRRAEYGKLWREQNKERNAEVYRRWAAKNRERKLASMRQWTRDNAAHKREYDRKYKQANPDRVRSHKAKRRAAVGAAIEQVDRRVVFQRDGYRCQLCGCETSGRHPAPQSPTLDHIVPLARGGDHSYANTQCACFRCNVRKGAREDLQMEMAA